jgi:hypothetical protein
MRSTAPVHVHEPRIGGEGFTVELDSRRRKFVDRMRARRAETDFPGLAHERFRLSEGQAGEDRDRGGAFGIADGLVAEGFSPDELRLVASFPVSLRLERRTLRLNQEDFRRR